MRSSYHHPKLYYQPRTKARYNNPAKKKLFVAGGVAFGLIIIIWFFFFSRYFMVRKIDLEGNNVISGATLAEQLTIDGGQNIFLFNTTTIEETLSEQFSLIEQVQVKKNILYPPTITVHITEHEPYVLWAVDDRTFAINDQGIVLGEYPIQHDQKNNEYPSPEILTIQSYPTLRPDELINTEVCEPALLEQVKFLSPKIPLLINEKISAIEAIDRRDIQFVLDSGIALKFSIDKNPSVALNQLQVLYQKVNNGEVTITEHVDLRVNQLFVK